MGQEEFGHFSRVALGVNWYVGGAMNDWLVSDPETGSQLPRINFLHSGWASGLDDLSAFLCDRR